MGGWTGNIGDMGGLRFFSERPQSSAHVPLPLSPSLRPTFLFPQTMGGRNLTTEVPSGLQKTRANSRCALSTDHVANFVHTRVACLSRTPQAWPQGHLRPGRVSTLSEGLEYWVEEQFFFRFESKNFIFEELHMHILKRVP